MSETQLLRIQMAYTHLNGIEACTLCLKNLI